MQLQYARGSGTQNLAALLVPGPPYPSNRPVRLLAGEGVWHWGLMSMIPFDGNPARVLCDPMKVDSDGDGLADGLEIGMTANELTAHQGSGVSMVHDIAGSLLL